MICLCILTLPIRRRQQKLSSICCCCFSSLGFSHKNRSKRFVVTFVADGLLVSFRFFFLLSMFLMFSILKFLLSFLFGNLKSDTIIKIYDNFWNTEFTISNVQYVKLVWNAIEKFHRNFLENKVNSFRGTHDMQTLK